MEYIALTHSTQTDEAPCPLSLGGCREAPLSRKRAAGQSPQWQSTCGDHVVCLQLCRPCNEVKMKNEARLRGEMAMRSQRRDKRHVELSKQETVGSAREEDEERGREDEGEKNNNTRRRAPQAPSDATQRNANREIRRLRYCCYVRGVKAARDRLLRQELPPCPRFLPRVYKGHGSTSLAAGYSTMYTSGRSAGDTVAVASGNNWTCSRLFFSWSPWARYAARDDSPQERSCHARRSERTVHATAAYAGKG